MSTSSTTSGSPVWLRRRERGSRLAMRVFVRLALWWGRDFSRVLLPPLCLYFLLFSLDSRRASRNYLSRVLGRSAGWRDTYRHYHTFASCILDRLYFLTRRTAPFLLNVQGEELLREVIARGEGCLLLGAHLGSFEALRALGRNNQALRVSMVMYEDNAQKLGAVLNAIDPELARDIISLGRPDTFVTLKQRLEEGHCVGVLADRSLQGERGSTQTFLGQPARFPTNPFRVFTLLDTPVVFMVALYRGGNRYDIHFEPFQVPRGRRATPQELEAMVGHYVARLEHYCRIAPYNWFNFFEFDA